MPGRLVIFVYGTLKCGLIRAHFLEGQLYPGVARSLPKYRMYNCGTYPGLQASENGLSIIGELWAVDHACLARLDQEECLNVGLFARQAIEMDSPLLEFVSRPVIEAYFYLRSVAGFPDCGAEWGD